MSTGTHTPEVPDSPGVYQIRCKRNGKFHVGSAANLRTRWDPHRRDLRRGSHHNPYLQLAWKLYGEINFELVVLESVDDDDHRLVRLLQTPWAGLSIHASPANGTKNLFAFCRDRGLDNTHMVAVANGRILSHRGRTHERGKKRLPGVVHKGFVAPGGAVVRTTNLSAFCRACGLSRVHMFQLKSGKRPSHKGWTWKHDADRAFE